jgi:hypothetical protein
MTQITSASPATAPDAVITTPAHQLRIGPLRSGNPRGNPNLALRAACPRAWPAGRQSARARPMEAGDRPGPDRHAPGANRRDQKTANLPAGSRRRKIHPGPPPAANRTIRESPNPPHEPRDEAAVPHTSRATRTIRKIANQPFTPYDSAASRHAARGSRRKLRQDRHTTWHGAASHRIGRHRG